MSEPTIEELQASVERLTKSLEAERAAHKESKRKAAEFTGTMRSALALGDDADEAAIVARLGDTESVVTAKTAALAAERDAARTEVNTIKAEWADFKITAALGEAFRRSGAMEQNTADYMALAKPLFTLGSDGGIVTRDGAPNTVPGMTPDQWIVAQLRSARPHWWPLSSGGGAKGAGGLPPSAGVDLSGFRSGNVTAMMSAIGTYGEAAVLRALRQSGIPAPAWLAKGAR